MLDADGELGRVTPFDLTPGRDMWYAGSVEVDGRALGPPLGIRSLTASASGSVILANVHVGGVPRSTDGGESWHPTIDVDADVHEIVAHPEREDVVIAAAAVGFCISRDGGATWEIETDGLHAHYCSAVAFLGEDVLVAASSDHFAQEGGVYRRPLDEDRPFEPLAGPPRWFAGIVDTGGITCSGSAVAIADRIGNVHVSEDGGESWECWTTELSDPSCLLIDD